VLKVLWEHVVTVESLVSLAKRVIKDPRALEALLGQRVIRVPSVLRVKTALVVTQDLRASRVSLGLQVPLVHKDRPALRDLQVRLAKLAHKGNQARSVCRATSV